MNAPELTCCGQAQAEPQPAGRFCIFCGTPTGRADIELDPIVVPADPHPDRPWTPLEERALAKALSDVFDGHLGLWGRTEHFSPDRQVSGLHDRDWIGELIRRGWVCRRSYDLRQLHVSDAGVEVVRAYRAERGPRRWTRELRPR